MRNDIIHIDEIEFKVEIKVEDRKDSRVSIKKNLINIRVPNFLPREEIFKEIYKMKLWAKQKILENPDNFKKEHIRKYEDGQEININGDRYTLKITFSNKDSSSASLKDNTIFLNISSNLDENKKSKHISTLISRCIARHNLPKVKKRVEELNNLHFQKEINKVFLKHNQSNWGSCSTNNNINISTQALFAPSEVFDYLCIHELAHLVEQNHSDNFWALVSKAMPDYKEKRNWLKENGDKCRF